MVADVSYVGNHGYNRLGALQGGDTQNWNAVDLGTAYLPKYQDPTLGAPAIPGGVGIHHEPAPSVRGLRQHRAEYDRLP